MTSRSYILLIIQLGYDRLDNRSRIKSLLSHTMVNDLRLDKEILMKRIDQRDNLIFLNRLIIPYQKQVQNPILIQIKYGHHLSILVVLQYPVIMVLCIHKLLVNHLPIRMCPIALWQILLIICQLLDWAQHLYFLVRDHFTACVDQDKWDLALLFSLIAAYDIRVSVWIYVPCSKTDWDCPNIWLKIIEIGKHIVKDWSVGLTGKSWEHVMGFFEDMGGVKTEMGMTGFWGFEGVVENVKFVFFWVEAEQVHDSVPVIISYIKQQLKPRRNQRPSYQTQSRQRLKIHTLQRISRHLMINLQIVITPILHYDQQIRYTIPIKIRISRRTGCTHDFWAEPLREAFISIHTWKRKVLKIPDNVFLGVLGLEGYFDLPVMVMQQVGQEISVKVGHKGAAWGFELFGFKFSQEPLVMVIWIYEWVGLDQWVIPFIAF